MTARPNRNQEHKLSRKKTLYQKEKEEEERKRKERRKEEKKKKGGGGEGGSGRGEWRGEGCVCGGGGRGGGGGIENENLIGLLLSTERERQWERKARNSHATTMSFCCLSIIVRLINMHLDVPLAPIGSI